MFANNEQKINRIFIVVLLGKKRSKLATIPYSFVELTIKSKTNIISSLVKSPYQLLFVFIIDETNKN